MRHRVRALAGALLVVGLVPVVGPARPAAAANNTALTPIYECGFQTSNGWVTVWGYTNSSDTQQSVDIGADNHFSPNSDVGQPRVFDPGTHDNVLIVPWDGNGTLQWHLGASKATAAQTPLCASNPVPITGTGLSSMVGIGMLAGMGFGLDRWLRRRRAKRAKAAQS
jgi:hypothetical protein